MLKFHCMLHICWFSIIRNVYTSQKIIGESLTLPYEVNLEKTQIATSLSVKKIDN
jgi:hypothetical protein